jgi:hypothetical protein
MHCMLKYDVGIDIERMELWLWFAGFGDIVG